MKLGEINLRVMKALSDSHVALLGIFNIIIYIYLFINNIIIKEK